MCTFLSNIKKTSHGILSLTCGGEMNDTNTVTEP